MLRNVEFLKMALRPIPIRRENIMNNIIEDEELLKIALDTISKSEEL